MIKMEQKHNIITLFSTDYYEDALNMASHLSPFLENNFKIVAHQMCAGKPGITYASFILVRE